jgi:hypothetical protein
MRENMHLAPWNPQPFKLGGFKMDGVAIHLLQSKGLFPQHKNPSAQPDWDFEPAPGEPLLWTINPEMYLNYNKWLFQLYRLDPIAILGIGTCSADA